MVLEDLEQLRLEAKMTRESLGADYSRYLELLRHAELAEKVMEIDDPRQKYSAFSHLIDKIVKDLPGEIIKQLEVLLSNHTLRFSDLCSDILPLAIYGGTSFSHCVTLLSHNRKELEQWECDDEATIAMRKEKLIYYKDHLIVIEGCDTPNSIYYRDGAYREYDEHKNSYYYRLGRMIQTHDADGCSLEITMQMACFYVALSNERSLVEDELMLKGEDIQMEWSDNMIVQVIEHLANFDYAVGTDGDSYDRYLATANLLQDNINGFVAYCQERHNSPQFQPMMIAFRNGINATIKSAERLGKMFANTMSNAPKLADVYYPGLECCHELVETCKRYKFWIDSFLPEPSSPEDEQAAQSPLPPSAEATATDDAQSSPKVDADRLGSFFNAKFKGSGNNPDRIKDLVNDIEKIKVTKELAMIAVMIYECRQYFIRRSSTFAAWLREFFDIIGRDCPKDTRKSKYKPDERIERLFYYLK